MIDGQNFFDQPTKMTKEHMITFQRLQLVMEMIVQLVVFFKEHYKMIAIGLSKQQELEADPIANQQIIFSANFTRNTTTFFLIKEAKETG